MAASKGQSPPFLVRRAVAADLDTLVEFNAAMALERNRRTLELDRAIIGLAQPVLISPQEIRRWTLHPNSATNQYSPV